MVREGEAYQEKTMAFKHDQSKGRWFALTCVAPYICLNVFCTVDLKCNVKCVVQLLQRIFCIAMCIHIFAEEVPNCCPSFPIVQIVK